MASTTVRVGALILAIVLNAGANILIKAGSRDTVSLDAAGIVRMMLDPYVIAGILSFGLALVCYTYTLTTFQLSIAYPIMTSVGLILVFLASVFWFREAVTLPKMAGTGLIMAGVVLLAREA